MDDGNPLVTFALPTLHPSISVNLLEDFLGYKFVIIETKINKSVWLQSYGFGKKWYYALHVGCVSRLHVAPSVALQLINSLFQPPAKDRTRALQIASVWLLSDHQLKALSWKLVHSDADPIIMKWNAWHRSTLDCLFTNYCNMEQLINSGIFHINCLHVISLYIRKSEYSVVCPAIDSVSTVWFSSSWPM